MPIQTVCALWFPLYNLLEINEKIIQIGNGLVVARSFRRFWLWEESEHGYVWKGIGSDTSRDGTVPCLNCINVSIVVVMPYLSSTRCHHRRNWAESTGHDFLPFLSPVCKSTMMANKKLNLKTIILAGILKYHLCIRLIGIYWQLLALV